MNLIPDTELADMFDLTVKRLHELRRQHGWPCVRLGRFKVMFTEEHVAQIVAAQTERHERKPSAKKAPITGQTGRSASRRRAG